MAIEIVDFPIKNGDFPWQNVSSPEGIKGVKHQKSWSVERFSLKPELSWKASFKVPFFETPLCHPDSQHSRSPHGDVFFCPAWLAIDVLGEISFK